jgi:hypothetical protein
MFKNPNIKLWRFPVQNNRSRFEDGGHSHFEMRSTEKAATLGLRIETVKQVRLQRLRNNAWMLNGIVVLRDDTAHGARHSSLIETRATI